MLHLMGEQWDIGLFAGRLFLNVILEVCGGLDRLTV